MKNLIQKFAVLIISFIFAATIAQAYDEDTAKIRKELSALLGTTNQGKEFFMTTYLDSVSNDSTKKGEKLIQIKQKVTSNEACITLSPYTNDAFADPYAELQELCLENIRMIDIHENQFGLNEVCPNPVGTNGADINYSLGFECTTEITIFNSVGSIVAKPVNKKQTAGLHNVPVPVKELASGLYFIELKAGPYVSTTKLVISK